MTQPSSYNATELHAYIRKTLRTKAARAANWPGVPVSHFALKNAPALRQALEDGVVKEVERVKGGGNYRAYFIAIP